MKKLLLLALLISATTVNSHAQSLVIGAKGLFASTWLFNANVSNAPQGKQTYVPAFGESYGLSGAIFFNEKLGVEMNFFYSNHRQGYTGDDTEYEARTTISKVDIPLMIKLKSETGAYFEIGVQFSAVQQARYRYKLGSVDTNYYVTQHFAKNSIDGIIGIGIDIELGAGLALTTALRFWGSITDIEGVDSYGNDLSDVGVLNQTLDTRYNYEGDYKETHSAAAGFLLGLTYTIGGRDKKKKKTSQPAS
ncbi:MAG TPA: hypothetical protein EYN38_09925 [Flavobacteriales bacterium]|nr:hypothetical protein [Flavobacteriales bacterium]